MAVFEMVDDKPMLKTGMINADGIVASSLQLRFMDMNPNLEANKVVNITMDTYSNLLVNRCVVVLPTDLSYIGKVITLYSSEKTYKYNNKTTYQRVFAPSYLRCDTAIYGALHDDIVQGISDLMNAESGVITSNMSFDKSYLVPSKGSDF